MFELILQPDEKVLQSYCGATVCVNLKDGTRKIGRMTACGAGRLILNGEEGELKAKVARKKNHRRTSRSRGRASPADSGDFSLQEGDWGALSIAPIGMEPEAHVMARVSIPLRTVESVVIL